MLDGLNGLTQDDYATRLRDHLASVSGVPVIDVFSDNATRLELHNNGQDGAKPGSAETAAKIAFISSFHMVAKGAGADGVQALARQHQQEINAAKDPNFKAFAQKICDEACNFAENFTPDSFA